MSERRFPVYPLATELVAAVERIDELASRITPGEPTGPEPGGVESCEDSVSQAAAVTAEPASPVHFAPAHAFALGAARLMEILADPHSRRVPDNVHPIRRPA